MNGYSNFAIGVTTVYLLYLLVMIAYDIYAKDKRKTGGKSGSQTVDVSDMLDEDTAREVSEDYRELDEVMQQSTVEEQDGIRIYSGPTPPSADDTPPEPKDNSKDNPGDESRDEHPMEVLKEELDSAESEDFQSIMPSFQLQLCPPEFENYLKEKHQASQSNDEPHEIDHL